MKLRQVLFASILSIAFSTPSFAGDKILRSGLDPAKVTVSTDTSTGIRFYGHIAVEGKNLDVQSPLSNGRQAQEWREERNSVLNQAKSKGRTVSIVDGRYGGNVRIILDNAVSTESEEIQRLKKRVAELEAELSTLRRVAPAQAKLSDSKAKPEAQAPIAVGDSAAMPSRAVTAQK